MQARLWATGEIDFMYRRPPREANLTTGWPIATGVRFVDQVMTINTTAILLVSGMAFRLANCECARAAATRGPAL